MPKTSIDKHGHLLSWEHDIHDDPFDATVQSETET